ncbi:MAG: hypothetical protein SRB1_02983 [Desulfobacteraceae bacterium Eth-SRB1]|nr:MAG: hypothetical protein SRB1_02983 [Desulfobacteraceae bacterium Eth-SRB1]
MNIFDVLSQGKGRLNEENLSAMLAFLLSPNQSHGLSDIFLRHFLDAIARSCGKDIINDAKPIRADILLESPYSLGKKRRVVDIEIRIFKPTFKQPNNKEELTETHRIAIENKIKAQAASPKQFKEEFEAILKDIEADNQVEVTMVFLTPSSKHKGLFEEYEMLDEDTLGPHKKSWLFWSDETDMDNTVVGLIRGILKKESEAEIPPMMEYLRHTLKAFVLHLLESSKGLITPTAEGYEIAEVAFLEFSKGKYRIERYENSTIRLVNLETQKYESAKPLLRKIIREKKLGVNLHFSSGAEKNTRDLGREVLKRLKQQGKVLEPY